AILGMHLVPPDQKPLSFDSLTRWPEVLERITRGFCSMAGIEPYGPDWLMEGRRPGRREGSAKDWLLSAFVGALWFLAAERGGELGASHKDGRGYGTLFEALELLRPFLPVGFLRTNAAQAIVGAVASAKSRYVSNSNFK